MSDRNLDPGQTLNDLRRTNRLCIGDMVEIENEEGKEIVATVTRFFPYLVQFETKEGRTFTMDYLSASKVRLIRPSGFESHNEAMDRNALLKALNHRKLGEKNGKKV